MGNDNDTPTDTDAKKPQKLIPTNNHGPKNPAANNKPSMRPGGGPMVKNMGKPNNRGRR